jgi:hypothetical protein
MTNSEEYTMTDEPNGTVFLEWLRSHGQVARLVQLKFKGQDALHLRVFYTDVQGNLKPSWSGLTIPLDQIEPLRKALRQVTDKSEPAPKSSGSKEVAVPKLTKKFNSWG